MRTGIEEGHSSPEERILILKYGYPFEGVAQLLKACRDSKDIEVVPIDAFELERLIGDPSISINDMKDGVVQDELLELCDRLKAAERYGDGQLDSI